MGCSRVSRVSFNMQAVPCCCPCSKHSTGDNISFIVQCVMASKLNEKEKTELMNALDRLSGSQQQLIKAAILGFGIPRQFQKLPSSDFVTDDVLENLGDRLLNHHVFSTQALSKDRFEFALEAALQAAGFDAKLAKSRTNRGHDITVSGVPISLKTEAAKNIKENIIHVSKWMELGKGEWVLSKLRDMFLEHMKNYERIFTLRCLSSDPQKIHYELVEIPKKLLMEAKSCVLETREDSRQNPKPGYGHVYDKSGNLKFSLYFDGGTERKLQIKGLRKDLCVVHATWIFSLPASA